MIQTRSKLKSNSVFITHIYVSLCVADAWAQLSKLCNPSLYKVDPSNNTKIAFKTVILTN